jgi:hypothetical protein
MQTKKWRLHCAGCDTVPPSTRPPTLRRSRHLHLHSIPRRWKQHIPRNYGSHPAEHHRNNHQCEHLKTCANNIIISGQLMSTNAYMALQLQVIIFSMVLHLGPGRFFSFVIVYTVGKTPWTGDQPVAMTLRTHRTTQAQNKCRQDIHTSTGIWTHDLSVRGDEDGSYLTARSVCDRPCNYNGGWYKSRKITMHINACRPIREVLWKEQFDVQLTAYFCVVCRSWWLVKCN